MDGEQRDVRTNPESPALWPDELSNLVLSLISPFKFPSNSISPGTGVSARSTHLFLNLPVTHPTATGIGKSLLATSRAFRDAKAG
jgi:hypothetical protein